MELYYTICNILDKINNLLWGKITIFLIFAAGIFLSFRYKFGWVLHPFKLLKQTIFAKHKDAKNLQKSLTTFQSLATALAASMGTGNIVGVAAAIQVGGVSSVFWMIVSSVFGMATAYAENFLGVKYRDKNGVFGPINYIKIVFKKWKISEIFAISVVACSFGIGNMSQSNSAVISLAEMGIPLAISAGILAIAVAWVLFGKGISIASVAEKIIPFISLIYILASLYIVVNNSSDITEQLTNFLSDSFGAAQIFGGISGYILKKSVAVGLRRGIFSNEAGMGSSVFAHANVENADPETMGLWAVLEIFIDTILCCTLTALVLISTNSMDNSASYGANITQAFAVEFGNFSPYFVGFSMTIFAFAAILGWYFYGENALKFLTKSKSAILIYRIFYVLAVFFGGIFSVDFIWNLSDIFNAMMLFPNLAAVLILSHEVEKPTFGTATLKKYKENA